TDDHVRDAVDDDVQRVRSRALLFVDDDASAWNQNNLIRRARDGNRQTIDRETLDRDLTAAYGFQCGGRARHDEVGADRGPGDRQGEIRERRFRGDLVGPADRHGVHGPARENV